MAAEATRRLCAAIFYLISGLALAGCEHFGRASRIDPLSVAVYPGGERYGTASADGAGHCPFVRSIGSFVAGAIDLDCFLFPEDAAEIRNSRPPAQKLAYARAVLKEIDRNRLTALLMKHSDDFCIRDMGQLTGNEAAVNTALSTLNTLATTTANIVTGEQAQQILTGVGTVAGATRSHINSHVYRNTFAYAISRAIARERERLRDAIEARYTAKKDVYTIDEAIRSVNEYHGVCSFYKGLELVLASVEGDRQSRDAQERKQKIDAMEDQVRRFREQKRGLTTEEAKPFDEAIAAIVGKIKDLTLAAAPNDAPVAPEDDAPVSTGDPPQQQTKTPGEGIQTPGTPTPQAPSEEDTPTTGAEQAKPE